MHRGFRFMLCAAMLLLGSMLFVGTAVAQDQWVATWATAPATYYVYVPPVPPAYPPGFPKAYAPAVIQPDLVFPFPVANKNQATNQTIRSIVKPDLWSNRMRFRFSNAFGTQPLSFDAVTVALQEYSGNVVKGTLTPVTFGAKKSVMIAPGQEVWSDGVALTWIRSADDPAVQGRNLAISYSVQGSSGPMTYHAFSNQTSYITAPGSGNHTADPDVFAYEFTTTSMFFLDAVDVMAAPGTVVICAFGASITDGAHTTLNDNDRWINALSRRLHNAYGNRISIVNEAIGGNLVVNPVAANTTAGPAAVDRLDRDVLGLSGLTHVIWLEGINDLGSGHPIDAVIAGYKDVVSRLHAKGIKVFAGTLTSALGMVNPAAGWDTDTPNNRDNGAANDSKRMILNRFIRTSGLFDGVEDFDAATLDSATGNMKAEYVPNSQMTQLPWDYLHPNHAGHLAMAAAVNIAPFKPR
jgi:lysophospholipase L1-like esterase